MKCKICKTRRPRRFCPGVRGDICSICCGTHREVTVDCPLDCEYLRDARKHEKPPQFDPEEVPNQDVRVTESFLRDHEGIVGFCGGTLLAGALETPGSVDYDVRESLDALVRTFRTLESGLVYETRPTNPVAAAIQQRFRQSLEEYRRQKAEQLGMQTIRDTDVLGVLVFFQRLEVMHNNTRKRGRAFIDFLRDHFLPGAEAVGRLGVGGQSPLIVP